MQSRWQFFTQEELTCRCGCGKMGMQDSFMDRVVSLRTRFGPLIVASAYRCPDHNAEVSGTGRTGPHTTGHALDIKVYGDQCLFLADLARSEGMTGVGFKQHGPHGSRFLHLDDLWRTKERPRPWVWTYG